MGYIIFFDNFIYIYVQYNDFKNQSGGEDDDMYYRLKYSNVNFSRPIKNTVYIMLNHTHQYPINPDRFQYLNKTEKNYKNDGLNSLNYKLNGIFKYALFTHLLIDVKEQYISFK
jgi:hypothetical protein